jgi:membrane-bound lytic murein transglycosylase A
MQTDRGFAQGSEGAVVAGVVGAIVFLAMTCCTAGPASAEGPPRLPGSQLEPVKWSELAGWTADDHLAAFETYRAGCRALHKTPRTDDLAQIHRALSNVCHKALGLKPPDPDTARAFFEQNFQPVRIARLGDPEGLVTGYFEPIVAGSRFPSPEFPVPLYRRPHDLVAVGYRPGSAAFPNKGVRIGRRNGTNELVPYYDRGAIEAGALDGQKLEICWLKDPFDLLAIQMEGSGRVILEDGTPLRVSFDSHNGYSYSSIERVLVERNLIPRKEMSRERIRAWMAAHPDEAAKVRATNRSYTFFRVTGLSNDGEPVGAQGVPLTPGRSIAVGRLHEYGTPFFIEANLPIESAKAVSHFGRLMIAQDTGSAVVGPARADLYLGAGDDAGRIADRIRHPGRFTMLLPRELDIVTAASEMPLPAPKPKIAGAEVGKQHGTGKAEPADAGRIAARRHMPVPTTKTKIAETGARKQDGKGKAEPAGAGVIAARRHMLVSTTKTKIAETGARKRDGTGKAEPAGAGVIAAGRHMPPPGKGKAEPAGVGVKVAGRHMPVPTTKPKSAETGARKRDGKGKAEPANAGGIAARRHMLVSTTKTKIAETGARKRDGTGKAEPAGAGVIAASRHMPPPGPKTKTPAIEVEKQDGKGKAEPAGVGVRVAGRHMPVPTTKTKSAETGARKRDGTGKAEPAGAGVIAAGRHMPSPGPKPKVSETEVRKQNGTGKAKSANAGEAGKTAARPGRQATVPNTH